MRERFEGEEGRALLLDALLKCEVVQSDEALAEELAHVANLREHPSGAMLLAQGAYDSDMAFLLSGEVEILVGDRVVARRRTGDHVGEMAAIDPRAPRSATVRAVTLTVAAWVDERRLVPIANRHPHLWRAFAATLADRLRERGQRERPRRMESRALVVGGAAPPEARADLERALSKVDASLVWWIRDGRPSTLPLDELRHEGERADFALVDLRGSRGALDAALELGLLVGMLGRERVFVLRSKDAPPPAYLDGLVLLEPETERWPEGMVSCITTRVRELGPR